MRREGGVLPTCTGPERVRIDTFQDALEREAPRLSPPHQKDSCYGPHFTMFFVCETDNVDWTKNSLIVTTNREKAELAFDS